MPRHLASTASMAQVVRMAPTQNAISSFTRNKTLKEGPLSLKIAAKTTRPSAPVIGAACNLHHGAAPSASPAENKQT